MRRAWPVLALVIVGVLAVSTAGLAAGPARLPTVRHEGRAYVELDRVAAAVRVRPDAAPGSVRAYLRVSGHTVTLTRNWARVVVDDRALVLDAPVRVRKGVWLVPDSFVERVLPRLAGAPEAPPVPSAMTGSTPSAVAPPGATLEDLRYRSYPSFTRVVLETSAPVSYRIEPGAGRDARVRVSGLTAEARHLEIRDGFVEEVRLERSRADAVVRVTFDGAPGEVRASTLADPDRLVLDFMRPGDQGEPRATTSPLKVMVLDAGHGGHDPGASGPTGLLEKELVLDVTRRVAKLVADQLGIKVLLSRDGDHFVPLRDRTSFANRAHADVFVSIHANAHRELASEGVETYFLSSEATDNAARQVAALENSVVQLEKPTGKGRGGVDVVKTILWDLAQSEFQEESSRLAEIVQDSMTQSLRIPSRGVKQAGFYVLGGAAMPAILIEIGFVTNPKEERKLRESRYRDDIARAITAGLREYKRAWDQRLRQAVGRSR